MLQSGEPAVYELLRPTADSPFLLTADHAGRAIPRVLGDLGVSADEMNRHIAWDIGIAGVTRRLSEALNATAILQNYSRLVIDCNRTPTLPCAFPAISEDTHIPGNKDLCQDARSSRQQAIFDPYHAEIKRLLHERQRTIYIAMHSMTPVYRGQHRAMHTALLYDNNARLSLHLADLLRAEPGLIVAENDPYKAGDGTDYGVPVHAEARGLDYLEIEIRQDLIEDEAGQAAWAERFARLLPQALQRLDSAPG